MTRNHEDPTFRRVRGAIQRRKFNCWKISMVLVFIVVLFLVEMDCAGFPWLRGNRESQIGLRLQVKFQCLPITAAGHGRIQRDGSNWYLVTVQNHLGQSAKRSDSSRDR